MSARLFSLVHWWYLAAKEPNTFEGWVSRKSYSEKVRYGFINQVTAFHPKRKTQVNKWSTFHMAGVSSAVSVTPNDSASLRTWKSHLYQRGELHPAQPWLSSVAY